jgi:peptidoglycan/xylan/chitin deacetylase (PgdA/CDA1 family)
MGRVLTLVPCLCTLFCMLPGRPPVPGPPIVVITFDDADTSVYTIAYPLIESTDSSWAATHFLPVTYAGAPDMVTADQLREMESAGWETGGHGWSHENLSSVPPDSAEAQIEKSYRFLVDSGLAHESYAYAFGNYNPAVASTVARYFKNIRTSHDFYYLDGVNRLELGYFAVKGEHTGADIIGRVERARAMGSPLVIIGFHLVRPENEPPVRVYWCRETAFREFLEYLKEQELTVLTLRDAMRVLCGD